MDRLLDIQTIGASLVLGLFICAEAAAWYLTTCPSSALAWYLNLGPFHIFQTARGSFSALHYLFAPQSLPIAIAAFAIVLLAWWFRIRLLVALAANLGFAFSIALIDAQWRGLAYVSLTPYSAFFFKQDFGFGLVLVVITSFVSCMASHVSFMAAIRSESRGTSPITCRRAAKAQLAN